jgi:3-hydroxyacyl-CoA dehydrogenase
MFYADHVGLHDVIRALERIAAQPQSDAAFWTPAPLLSRLAEQGRTFSGYKGQPK